MDYSHCINGHPYDPSNTHWMKVKAGWRRACCSCNGLRPKAKEDEQ